MENVVRFRQLLMTYPIVVVADDLRVAVFAHRGRRLDGSLRQDVCFELCNHALMCEVSKLFWGDEDVFNFVMDHQGLEVGLTGARVKSIQGGPVRIPQKGEVPQWKQTIDPETGEVKEVPSLSPSATPEPVRAHQAKIEIKSKYLKLTI